MLNRGRQDGKWSFADMLRSGLGGLKAESRKRTELRDQAYRLGYREAETRFKVLYGCSICGKPIPIQAQDEKRAAAECMRAGGWGHEACHKTRGHASL